MPTKKEQHAEFMRRELMYQVKDWLEKEKTEKEAEKNTIKVHPVPWVVSLVPPGGVTED